jgi:two-component system phosphate regulon response regulator PhoB
MAGGTASPRSIVVVEDEKDLGALLEYVLGGEGFEVQLACSGREALEALDGTLPDLVLLDLMLPDMDGFDVLRTIRKREPTARTRVIVLSARKDEEDRIRGLELGADDYVVKPFSPRELVLRIKGLFQREREPGEKKSPPLLAGPIAMDLDHHEVRVEGKPVHLTLTEFRLLSALVRHQGRVRTRESLLTDVWGYDSEAMSRTVDTHVRRLRSKLGPAASRWLTTVRGVGYRIREPRES